MKKLQIWFSKLSKLEKIVVILVILATLFRIFLAGKIPLHIQADATYDDRMLVNYASNLLSFKWLGPFDRFSLAKGCSYSIFLAANFVLGIPYAYALIFTYIFAIILLCVALRPLIKNKTFLAILYTVLLYSPVMFHDENVQKIYRGGVIICFAMIVVAGVIGLYTRLPGKTIKKSKSLFWSILTSLALAFFWFLKEDSIWILPFALGGIALLLWKIFHLPLSKKRRLGRAALAILPLFTLGLSILGYKTINYLAYGEFAVTDRGGTYFQAVASDLLHIEGENRSPYRWVTKDMFNKAYAVSPTLSEIKPFMDQAFQSGWIREDGGIEGDIIFWVIKDAVAEYGIYDKGGATVDAFYRQIHEELSTAFAEGRLDRNQDFYISSVAKGINSEEMPEFLNVLAQSADTALSYKYNETGVYQATGDANGIALFSELTMSQSVTTDPNSVLYRPARLASKTATAITSVYQKTGKIIFYLFITAFIVFTIFIIRAAIKKTLDSATLSIYLIVLGIFATCLALFFGTTFFCRFLSQKKLYDYASPMLPLLSAIELIVFYQIAKAFKTMVKSSHERKAPKNSQV